MSLAPSRALGLGRAEATESAHALLARFALSRGRGQLCLHTLVALLGDVTQTQLLDRLDTTEDALLGWAVVKAVWTFTVLRARQMAAVPASAGVQ